MNNNLPPGVAQTQMLSYLSESARTRNICGQATYPASQAYSAWPVFLKGRPDQPIRVLLIDDDPHTRSVISNELLGDSRTDLVACAATQREGWLLVLRCKFDVMVVDRAVRPLHGHIVVAQVEGEFTVKYLHCRHGLVRLVAANPTYPDIVPRDGQTLEVWGVVTASIKQFKR